MSKKHKIAKKEAQAQKKLFDGDESLEKIKEIESGVVELDDQTFSSDATAEENAEEVVIEEADKAEVETVEEKKDAKSEKSDKPAEKSKVEEKKKQKDKNKKGKKKENKKGLVKKTKETASELKKVTWPTFGDVVKKTGIVIAFVVIFGLLIFGVDTLLAFLSGLLI